MSNLGFHKAVEEIGLKDVVTQVGDRYVVEEMRKMIIILVENNLVIWSSLTLILQVMECYQESNY